MRLKDLTILYEKLLNIQEATTVLSVYIRIRASKLKSKVNFMVCLHEKLINIPT